MKIIERHQIGLGNRDGDLDAVRADDGKFYLVLSSDTSYGREVFEGCGAVNVVEISEAAYTTLANY